MKNQLYIIVEGGVIQSVCSNNPKEVENTLEVVVVDYDIEGSSSEELTPISGGGYQDTEFAIVSRPYIEKVDIDVPILG